MNKSLEDCIKYLQQIDTLVEIIMGVVVLVGLYIRRSRIKVRNLTERTEEADSNSRPCIVFEVENIGQNPLSLDPIVDFTGYTPKGQRIMLVFKIKEQDRSLPPSHSRTFTAITDPFETFPFLWFMSYRITPTRGRHHVIYIRSADGENISRLHYLIELRYFKKTGRVCKKFI
jgi:hypothetical protein